MTEGTVPLDKKILIIDDNNDIAEVLKVLLTMEGHDVRVAHDGETGIIVAQDFLPDICLCDIGLPKMNGYEVGRQLRALLPNAKLIAFSGWGQVDDKERSREAGFDEHLVKASDLGQLMKLIV